MTSVDGAAGPAHLEVRGRGALKMVPLLAVCALLGKGWTVTAKAGLRPAGWPAPATTGQGRAPRLTTRVAVTADDADGAAHADDLATTAAAMHNQGTTPNSCPADDAGARIQREENQDQQSLTPTRALPCQSRGSGVDGGRGRQGSHTLHE